MIKASWVAALLVIGIKAVGQALIVTTQVYGPMGKVTVYQPAKIQSVVLFVSGDGGWNKGVVDLARVFTNQNALVIGIDNQHYMRQLNRQHRTCCYPASDFENLSLFIQKKYHLKKYLKPILVGYSSGATLVYGMLAQAPGNTFKGAIALGFCPDLNINKPFCVGAGLKSRLIKKGETYYLEAVSHLSAPFVAVVGQDDKVCNWQASERFLKSMKNATFIAPAGVGHGFLTPSKWLPQVEAAYQTICCVSTPDTVQLKPIRSLPADIPLVVSTVADNTNGPMAIMISGDGGWTSFDQELAKSLAERGIPSVGLDAQKYFWNARTPAGTTADVCEIINFYATAWKKPTFILIGYSFGGNVLPFVVNRLPAAFLTQLRGTVLFSPTSRADFEIHVLDMLNLNRTNAYDVLGEIAKIRTPELICVFGSEEDQTEITRFRTTGVRVVIIPGNHHYNNDYRLMANTISHLLHK